MKNMSTVTAILVNLNLMWTDQKKTFIPFIAY